MDEMNERTAMLIGTDNVERLKNSRVAVFGIGGVGSYAAEALARSGVGSLTLIDHDVVAGSNINRQLIALNSTIGKYKADVMKERILDINPNACVAAEKLFFLPGEESRLSWDFDYIADAVDNITAKIHLVLTAQEKGIPIISSMGTGNKLDGSRFRIADIYETSVCPLAKVMRKELKSRSVSELKVVFSDEPPQKPMGSGRTPSSIAFVPSCAGLIIAGEIVRDLCSIKLM